MTGARISKFMGRNSVTHDYSVFAPVYLQYGTYCKFNNKTLNVWSFLK
jgi:hypothetical protein